MATVLYILILGLVSLPSTPSFAWEDDIEEIDPYRVSLSGSFHGHVKFEEECRGRKIETLKNIRIKVLEVETLGEERQMGSGIMQHNWRIDHRIPYRDYVVQLYHLRERYVISEIQAPAYNSPEKFEFEFDCQTIMKEIYESRRQRKKDRLAAEAKALKEIADAKERKRLRKARALANQRKKELVEANREKADKKTATEE